MLAIGLGDAITAASTITPTHDIHHITGTTVVQTINPPNPEFCGLFMLIADDSPITFGHSGNISVSVGEGTVILPNNRITLLVYDTGLSKWVLKL